MADLILYGTCGFFGFLQIFVGIYWFYIMLRDHYKPTKREQMEMMQRTELKSVKSVSGSVPSSVMNIPDSPTDGRNTTPEPPPTPTSIVATTQNTGTISNTATLPYKLKLYTNISILGFTLYVLWVILYYAYTFFANEYVIHIYPLIIMI